MMNVNETLIKYFEDKTDSIIIDGNNNKKILEFLNAKIPEKYNLVEPLVKDLVKPHGKDQLYLHIAELYNVEKATMILTDRRRDHVIHALNTFLLGLYINDNFLVTKVHGFQWKLASLFHDIAYPLEISQEIIGSYLDKMRDIKNELDVESFNPVINLVPINFEKLTHNKNAFEYIQKKIDEWELDVNVRKRYADMISSNKICHGMLSALTVLLLVDRMYEKKNPDRKKQTVINGDYIDWNQEDFENHIVSACSAIFVHNLSKDAFKKIKKDKAPLPYLLKLCDELQTWQRPKNGLPNGDPPEKYSISIQSEKIIFKVKGEKDDADNISRKINCLNDDQKIIVKPCQCSS
ncbi:MAG: hypothetical protein O8C67_05790 [Candidatus Methanoperedens sp.]|nr:hypothetical protein [Candidatus Methanoperedens sp.]